MHAYADDNATATHAIYAAFVLPDRLCPLALSHLADFKRTLDVPIEAELHCHELFHTSKREKSEWRNVRLDAAEAALRVLCRSLRQISADSVSAAMPFVGLTAPKLGPDHPAGISEVKGIATLGYTTIHQGLINAFGRDGVRLWLDVDTAKIPWGSGRRQAHLTREFFASLEGKDVPALAHPDREPPPYPQLFEIADLYAYAMGHRDQGTRAAFFADLCDTVGLKPWGAVFAAEPQWEPVDVPRRIGQVIWRLQRDAETAVCFFEPFGEGFVWVEVQNVDERVTREQRICEHPREIASAAEEFRIKYLADGWVDGR